MQFVMKSGDGAPPGAYHAEFVEVSTGENDLGKHLVWQWKIVSGEHTGKTVRRITPCQPTLKNACGKILTGLSGKSLVSGDAIDISTFKGKNYLVVVSATENGGTRVESCALPPAQ